MTLTSDKVSRIFPQQKFAALLLDRLSQFLPRPDRQKTALVFFYFTVVFINDFSKLQFCKVTEGVRGSTISMGSQMLISIETLITYDFSEGGGAFYCVCEHQSFGPNIASVANWVCQDSSKRYELFLKSYCLLRYMSIAASEKKHKSTMSL